MPESVTDGDTPEDLLIDATDHPDGLDLSLIHISEPTRPY